MFHADSCELSAAVGGGSPAFRWLPGHVRLGRTVGWGCKGQQANLFLTDKKPQVFSLCHEALIPDPYFSILSSRQVQRSHGAVSPAPCSAPHPGGSTEQPADVTWCTAV